MCARVANQALLRGLSTSPLEALSKTQASRRNQTLSSTPPYTCGNGLDLQASSLKAAERVRPAASAPALSPKVTVVSFVCRLPSSIDVGARANAAWVRQRSRLCAARQARIALADRRGALNRGTMSPLLAAAGPHAHSRACGAGF